MQFDGAAMSPAQLLLAAKYVDLLGYVLELKSSSIAKAEFKGGFPAKYMVSGSDTVGALAMSSSTSAYVCLMPHRDGGGPTTNAGRAPTSLIPLARLGVNRRHGAGPSDVLFLYVNGVQQTIMNPGNMYAPLLFIGSILKEVNKPGSTGELVPIGKKRSYPLENSNRLKQLDFKITTADGLAIGISLRDLIFSFLLRRKNPLYPHQPLTMVVASFVQHIQDTGIPIGEKTNPAQFSIKNTALLERLRMTINAGNKRVTSKLYMLITPSKFSLGRPERYN